MLARSGTGPAWMSAVEASASIAAGRLTAEALASACLDRVTERDDTVRAWTHVDPEMVLAHARALDAAPRKGPLHGIPVGIKDILLTRDMPTSYNSELFAGHFPRLDAAAVAVLREAGAVIFGKNDTVEFAVDGRRARTRNPHDPSRTPGGSSSGSAAAVADFQVPLSLGTQTGGSTIRPAAYCGVYGMKPTWNLVPHEGFKVCSASIDTIGFYARCAADLGLLCDAFEVDDGGFAPLEALEGARVGLCRTPVWAQALPETRAAMALAQGLLRKAGAEVVELDLGADFERLAAAHRTIMQSEMRSAFLPEHVRFGDRLYPGLRDAMRNADGISRADQVRAYDLAARCRAAFDEIAAGLAFVVTPSVPGEAPAGLESTGTAVFNRMWTLLHVPCVNVPGFAGPNGMPVGLTVNGPRFADRRVLGAAELLGALVAADGAKSLEDRAG